MGIFQSRLPFALAVPGESGALRFTASSGFSSPHGGARGYAEPDGWLRHALQAVRSHPGVPGQTSPDS